MAARGVKLRLACPDVGINGLEEAGLSSLVVWKDVVEKVIFCPQMLGIREWMSLMKEAVTRCVSRSGYTSGGHFRTQHAG